MARPEYFDLVSAHPAELRSFAGSTDGMTRALGPRIRALGDALDRFRATAGWEDFLSDVPPLDIDAGVVRGRVGELRAFTRSVAAAFEAASLVADPNGVVHAMAFAVDSRIDVSLGEPTELVRDGDRWIYPGSVHRDFVRVVIRDGRTYLEVGVEYEEDGRHGIRWETRELTPEQAANLVIRTGGGDDIIAVSPDVHLDITVWSGHGSDQVGMPGENYSSRLGGSGNDRIFTGDGGDQVFAGAGDDVIFTGDGDDFVDGQDGDDRVVTGDGEDVAYGGRGRDDVWVGGGDDYADGGSGNDVVYGGEGRDIVSGGRDNDVVRGGDDDDELFGGRGDDTVEGGMGDDKATNEAHDSVTGTETRVTIELSGEPGSYAIDLGSRPGWMTEAEWDAWVERINNDLEFLRTTHAGRAGLEALDQTSRDSDSTWSPIDSDTHIRIVPYAPVGRSGFSVHPEPMSFDEYVEAIMNDEDPYQNEAAYAVDEWISYRPELTGSYESGPPARVLYHELSHGWDHMHNGAIDLPGRTYSERVYDRDGNLLEDNDVNRGELNSVGFDLDGDGGIDTVAAGDRTDHPAVLTENALRDELCRPRRISYRLHIYENDSAGRTVEYGDTGD